MKLERIHSDLVALGGAIRDARDRAEATGNKLGHSFGLGYALGRLDALEAKTAGLIARLEADLGELAQDRPQGAEVPEDGRERSRAPAY